MPNYLKPIKDPVKFFASDDSAKFMPAKELMKRLEKMILDAKNFNPDDIMELSFFVRRADDGVVITFPNQGSVTPLNVEEYIRPDDSDTLRENEIRVSDYIKVLESAVKVLKKARNSSVRFKFHDLVKYGVILGIPDYGYTNIGDMASFIR